MLNPLYIYIHIYISIYIYIHIFISIYPYIYMDICIHIYIYIHISIYISIYPYIYIHIFIYPYIYISIHIDVYMYIHNQQGLHGHCSGTGKMPIPTPGNSSSAVILCFLRCLKPGYVQISDPGSRGCDYGR